MAVNATHRNFIVSIQTKQFNRWDTTERDFVSYELAKSYIQRSVENSYKNVYEAEVDEWHFCDGDELVKIMRIRNAAAN